MKDKEYSLTTHFQQYAANLGGGLTEVFNIVRDYPSRFQKKTSLGKVVSVAKLTSVPASIALTTDAPVSAQLLGVSALGMVFASQRVKHNKHKNALSAPLAFILSAQKLLLGASGYAIMAGIAGVRGLTMAMLSDDEHSQSFRNRVAYGFAAVGVVAIGATGVFISPWNFLPMGSMLMGTFASARIDKKSYQARALYLIGNINNTIYSVLYSGSAAAGIIDATSSINHGTTILENDVPRTKKNGERLSLSDKASGYFRGLFNSDHHGQFEYVDKPEVKPKTHIPS